MITKLPYIRHQLKAHGVLLEFPEGPQLHPNLEIAAGSTPQPQVFQSASPRWLGPGVL